MRPEVANALDLVHSGQPAAVEQALVLLQNTVFSFSMKVCGHREDAEDTMQDVLIKALPYLPKFDSPKALAVWLYTVAKNRCLMSRRKGKSTPRAELSLENLMPDAAELDHLAAMADGKPTPESSLLQDERAEQLRQAVLRLPPSHRLILVLHDMEELSTEEIARITRLSEGNVRVRLHRARLLLRKELTQAEMRSAPAAKGTPKREKTPFRPAACKQMFAELSDYLDGVLDDSLCEELERHIVGCKPCVAFLDSLKNTIAQVKKTSPAQPDPNAAAELRRKILADYGKAMAAR